MGGPLGALSAAAMADHAQDEARYAALLDDVVGASEAAAAAGLKALLIEPTPLPREIPHTVAQARRLIGDLQGRTAVPIRWVIDVGHALYRPLYGEEVKLEDWLHPLRDDIGLIHLQNHDFRSDAHWGWPDDRGSYDVGAFADTVHHAGLTGVPVAIELFFPFEQPDEAVLATLRGTVSHCRDVLAGVAEEGLSRDGTT
jgi:hypothetical protein